MANVSRLVPLQEPERPERGGGVLALPVLSYGFRTFFLLAAAWGALAVALWVAMLATGWSLPLGMPDVVWHGHEMLFGFAGAGIGGFLLTAVPSWTGRPPAVGGRLLLLAVIWLAGRLVLAFGAAVPAMVVALIDLAFFVGVLLVAGADVVAVRNKRNYVVLAAIALFATAAALTHAPAWGLDGSWADVGMRAGMHIVVLLIALIGGRIVPAFTGNWLKRIGRPGEPAAFGSMDFWTLVTAIAAAVFDIVATGFAATGILLVTAGAMHLVRLFRWQGHQTFDEPIVWVLHLGYLWVAVGSLLLGASALTDAIPRIAGVHALTAGAVGTMLLAVMSRASLGHTGRALVAGPATVVAYVLVTVAAVLRVVAPWTDAWLTMLVASAAAWVAAFGLFFVAYLPVWLKPRVD